MGYYGCYHEWVFAERKENEQIFVCSRMCGSVNVVTEVKMEAN